MSQCRAGDWWSRVACRASHLRSFAKLKIIAYVRMPSFRGSPAWTTCFGDWRRLKRVRATFYWAQLQLQHLTDWSVRRAQAALYALDRGAEVVLCSRRPLQTRHFDLPLSWFDQRKVNRERFAFFEMSHAERLQWMKGCAFHNPSCR